MARYNNWKRWAFLLALAVLTPLAAACRQSAQTSPAGSDEPPKAISRENDWWKQKHAEIVKRVSEAAAEPGRPVRLAFIGDSITEGWQTNGIGAWQEKFVPRGAVNLGIGGDQTAHVMYRISQGSLSPVKSTLRVVVLMIGTNDLSSGYTPERTAQGVRSCVTLLQQALPQVKILLLAVPPREQTPGELRAKVIALNQLIKPIADESLVFFRDHGSLFIDPDGTIPIGLMPDFLHLSALGYVRWAEAIEKDIGAIEPGLATATGPGGAVPSTGSQSPGNRPDHPETKPAEKK